MMGSSIAKLLIFAGLTLTVIGILIYFAGNRFGWFGNLPGDIKIEKQNFSFYAPIASMLLLSLVVSLLIWLIRRFF